MSGKQSPRPGIRQVVDASMEPLTEMSGKPDDAVVGDLPVIGASMEPLTEMSGKNTGADRLVDKFRASMEPLTEMSGKFASEHAATICASGFNGAAHRNERKAMSCDGALTRLRVGFNGAAHRNERKAEERRADGPRPVASMEPLTEMSGKRPALAPP